MLLILRMYITLYTSNKTIQYTLLQITYTYNSSMTCSYLQNPPSIFIILLSTVVTQNQIVIIINYSLNINVEYTKVKQLI